MPNGPCNLPLQHGDFPLRYVQLLEAIEGKCLKSAGCYTPHVVNVGKLWGPKRKHGNKRESSFQLVFCMTVIFTYKKIIWIRWIYCSCISRDIPMIIHSTTQWYRISHTILEYVCEFMWIHVNSCEFMWIQVHIHFSSQSSWLTKCTFHIFSP